MTPDDALQTDFETVIAFMAEDKRTREFHERCAAFERAMQGTTPKVR